METQTIIERIETIVDSHGIAGVLAALEIICRERAEQPIPTAPWWRRNAQQLEIVHRAVCKPLREVG